jgi:arsenate reductase
MAEAFVNRLCGDAWEAQSAGLELGKLNPLVIEVMNEADIDISGNATKSVADILRSEQHFDAVVTVCDEASAERCPTFPGGGWRLHWGLPDPSQFAGTWDEKLAQTRTVRDAIRAQVEQWCAVSGNEESK